MKNTITQKLDKFYAYLDTDTVESNIVGISAAILVASPFVYIITLVADV